MPDIDHNNHIPTKSYNVTPVSIFILHQKIQIDYFVTNPLRSESGICQNLQCDSNHQKVKSDELLNLVMRDFFKC